MANRIDQRLAALNISLPEPSIPSGNIVPYVIDGDRVYLSGQGPVLDNQARFVGKLGADLTLDDGQKAARLCALNLLAQLKLACNGDLDRVTQVMKLVGFVNATEGYTDIAHVVNGASDIFVEVFGEGGKHSRSTLGASSLPRNSAVVVEAFVRIK